MTTDMRAALLTSTGGPDGLSVARVPRPRPGLEEVLIQVEACGINRVDILIRDGQTPTAPPLPHILGCEVAGTIVEVGPGTRPGWLPGDHVVSRPLMSCGLCRACRTGHDNVCDNLKILGVDAPGGYAEFVVVPQRGLLRLPGTVSARTAAAVVGTGPTAWHMLVTRGRLQVGETVLIIAGASGIGVLAIQIAKRAGARVIATAGSASKRERLLDLGADEVVDHMSERWHRQVRQLTGGEGVDLVFEHVGQATWASSISSLRKGGRLVTCGGHTGFDVSLNLWPLFAKEIEVIGSFAGTTQDLHQVFGAVARGEVSAVVHGSYGLEEAALAQRQLEDRSSVGKVVLVP
ncbi:MAG TPA: zinc-binding dehydrogenase [Streptosporangiaceae bacterium]|nr:zinc-binding dehydrogenase [Streptosporangiaceae bacterium]